MAEELIQNEDQNQITAVHDSDLRTTASDRLMEVYRQIAADDDPGNKLACLLTTSNYYNYALKIANDINGRQGKNRLTISESTSQLMRYSFDTDADEILDQYLIDTEISILNTYLADKMVLPSNPTKSAGIQSRVKSLIIMLTTSNQYDIIPKLNLPMWILSRVAKLFEWIQNIRTEVLNDWISWLEQNGYKEMADIVRQAGNEFWGSEGIKPNVIYDRYFGKIQDKIKDPNTVYNKYLEFRAEYRKSTIQILPSRVYDIMGITKDAYRNGRQNVVLEIKQLFPEEEGKNVIQRLIYEED